MQQINTLIEEAFFIVGAERSGTSLLQLMLDHHPNLVIEHEFEYAFKMIDRGKFPPVSNYCDWLESQWLFRETNYIVNRNQSFRSLIYSFLEQKTLRNTYTTKKIGAIVHHDFHRIKFLWPNAKYIHIVRDPRDVAPSVVNMGWSGNVWKAVDRWITAEKLWESIQDNIAPGNTLTIRYEDLVKTPEDILSKICNFLNMPYNESMLSYHKTTNYDSVNPDFAQKWLKNLSDFQIQLIESKVFDMLETRHYQPSNLKSYSPSKPMHFILYLDDKLKRVNFRHKRYGILLVTLFKLLKLLPFQGLRKRVQVKMDEIDRTFLK